jgi:hypothetical protein
MEPEWSCTCSLLWHTIFYTAAFKDISFITKKSIKYAKRCKPKLLMQIQKLSIIGILQVRRFEAKFGRISNLLFSRFRIGKQDSKNKRL